MAVAAICFFSLGCGPSPVIFPNASRLAANQDTTCNTTLPTTQSNGQFAVQPSQTTLSLYPGQTATVDVALPTLNGAAVQQLQIAADHLPVGLNFTSVQSTSGNIAHLTFQSTTALAFNCFAGVADVYSATVPISIVATGPSGTASSNIDLTVVLENLSFLPTNINLPVMRLTTDDGADITSKDDYVDGTVQLMDSSNSSNNFRETMQIQGHGNSTWTMPKKPYNLKLDSKQNILGMAASKKWVLLANYDDKTMMRNALAFYFSQMFQMEWTPNSKFVELYLNGIYEGVYQVTEKVEIDPNRLNIDELDDTDNSGIELTGGYLLEIDSFEGATFVFHTPKGLPVDSDDPDPPTAQQQNYITTIVDNAENALYSPNFKDATTGWSAFFDKSSLVNWFIVEELIGNQDGDFWSSDYFYKKRGDPLLYMGPVWDFDITAGNVDYGVDSAINPTLPWIRSQALWYEQLFQDPAFLAAVKARWTEIRPQVNNIPSFIDTTAAALAQGQQNNFQRWPILYDRVWPNPVAYGSYSAEVGALKNWMAARVTYMDKNYLQ